MPEEEVKSLLSTSRLRCNMCGARSGAQKGSCSGETPRRLLPWYRFLSNRSNAFLRLPSLGFATAQELCVPLSACTAYYCYLMVFEIMRLALQSLRLEVFGSCTCGVKGDSVLQVDYTLESVDWNSWDWYVLTCNSRG